MILLMTKKTCIILILVLATALYADPIPVQEEPVPTAPPDQLGFGSIFSTGAKSSAQNLKKLIEKGKKDYFLIAIDPGHGGRDFGGQGTGGLKEKEVCLDIALRLKQLIMSGLDNSQVRVFCTRETDQDLPLDKRYAMVNNNNADIYIGLHAGASFSR